MASRKTLLLMATVAIAVAAAALLPAPVSAAKTHRVGDDSGWDIGVNYDAWASGKTFRVGDKLVFRYAAAEHDVVQVDAQGYADCAVPDNAAPPLTSGDDTVVLQAGRYYFICDVEGHCDSGMKLTVFVQ